MLWSECFFFLICMCLREWRGSRTHTRYSRSLDGPIHSSVSLISFALRVFPSPRGPLRAQNKKKKRTQWFMYTSYLCWSSEGRPGLLSQQRTAHHFLLSSLLLGLITESKHSGSMILLVSQGRLLIQFSPQHCTVWRFCNGVREKKTRTKKKVGTCYQHLEPVFL